jgi:hypothetical protein
MQMKSEPLVNQLLVIVKWGHISDPHEFEKYCDDFIGRKL